MFPNFIVIIDVTARGTNKALSFWVVTMFDPVWVIKNHILDGFLVNSVLAWPQIASGRSQAEQQKASHISGAIASNLLSGHKGCISSFSQGFQTTVH